MAAIVENIIGNRALELGGEEFVRKLQFGSNWNKLRIGMRFVVNGSANIPAPRRLVMGLCDGDQATYLSTACVSFGGIGWGLNNGGPWTYDGVNGYYGMYAGGSVSYVLSKVGASLTETSTLNNITRYVKTGLSGQPHVLLVEMARTGTSGVYTTVGYAPDSTDILSIPTFYNFMLPLMQDETYSTAMGVYVVKLSAADTTGLTDNLDTLSIYWSQASPTIEISDLCVLRFY